MRKYLSLISENKYAALFVLTLITSILYFNSLSIGFLSDDYGFLWQAKEYGWSAFEHNFNDPFFIPLSHVIAMSVYSLVGDNAIVFHLLQLLVHILIGWQLYLFLKEYLNETKGFEKIAFLSALFFLIFPYQTEAVLWLSSKSYGYSLLFGLLFIRQFFKYYNSKKNIHLIICSLFLISSIATKEFGFMLPAIITLLLWNKGKFTFKLLPIVLFSIIIISSITIRWVVLSDWTGGYGADTHFDISVIGWHYFAYAVKFFSHIRYSDGSLVTLLLMSILTLISFGGILISLLKGKTIKKSLIVTLLLFAISLLPVISLEISSLHSIESDRYGYWASIVVCSALAIAINRLPRYFRSALTIIWSVLFISLAWITAQNWNAASLVKENFLSNLVQIPENNLLIINTPDNFNGAYILRNGTNDYLNLKESNKTITQVDFQTFTNLNGGVTIEDNGGFQDNNGASFYYQNPKLDQLKNIQKGSLPFDNYDAIYYFNEGKFFKIEKP